jgi:hypothetical protein
MIEIERVLELLRSTRTSRSKMLAFPSVKTLMVLEFVFLAASVILSE